MRQGLHDVTITRGSFKLTLSTTYRIDERPLLFVSEVADAWIITPGDLRSVMKEEDPFLALLILLTARGWIVKT